jgi:hypothetical protein
VPSKQRDIERKRKEGLGVCMCLKGVGESGKIPSFSKRDEKMEETTNDRGQSQSKASLVSLQNPVVVSLVFFQL